MRFKKTFFVTVLAICATIALQTPRAFAQPKECNYWKTQMGLQGAGAGGVIGAMAKNSAGGFLGGVIIGGIVGLLLGSAADSQACPEERSFEDYKKRASEMAYACIVQGKTQSCQGQFDGSGAIYSISTVTYVDCLCHYVYVRTPNGTQIVPVCGTMNGGRFVYSQEHTIKRININQTEINIALQAQREREQAAVMNAHINASNAHYQRYLALRSSERNIYVERGVTSGLTGNAERLTLDQMRERSGHFHTDGSVREESRAIFSQVIAFSETGQATINVPVGCPIPTNANSAAYVFVNTHTCRYYESSNSLQEAQNMCNVSEAHFKKVNCVSIQIARASGTVQIIGRTN